MILGRRRSRVVGTIWGLVALGFTAAAVLLWLDARRISFEVPAAIVATVLAWMFARQRAELDRHGVCTRRSMGEERLLWAGVDRVEVRRTSWLRPGLVVHPKGAGEAIPVPASAALRRRQRNRLLEFLTDLSRQHGFTLVTVSGDVISGTRPEALATTTARVKAVANGEPIFGPGGSQDHDESVDDERREPDVDAATDAASADATGAPGDHDGEAVNGSEEEPDPHPLTPPWLLPSATSGPVADLD